MCSYQVFHHTLLPRTGPLSRTIPTPSIPSVQIRYIRRPWGLHFSFFKCCDPQLSRPVGLGCKLTNPGLERTHPPPHLSILQNWRAAVALLVSVPPNFFGLINNIKAKVHIGTTGEHLFDIAYLLGASGHGEEFALCVVLRLDKYLS